MPNDLEQEALAESLKKQPGAGFTQGPDAGDEDRPAIWDDTKGSWIGPAGVQLPFTGIYEPGAWGNSAGPTLTQAQIGGVKVQPDGRGTLQPIDGDFEEVEISYEQPPDPPSAPPKSTEDAIVAHLDAHIENLRSEISRLGLKLSRALNARRELKDEIPF